MENISIRKITFIVLSVVALIFVLFNIGKIGEDVGAGEIVIVQDPFDGELHVYSSPGWNSQNFGTATHYKKSNQFWFSLPSEASGERDGSISVKWGDGAHAAISGSARFDLPTDETTMIKLHSTFGSQEAVEAQLIRTVMEKSIYMTGPLMTSKESYAEKRNDIIYHIEEQASKGVYRTRTKEVKTIDQMTGTEKTVSVVDLVTDSGGNVLRQEQSPLLEYTIKLYNVSINKIIYDTLVERQIAQQQQAIMQVQTAIAKAKEAEQRALTVAADGKASAESAKWEQEVIKAKLVTEAEQKLAVQKLATTQAEYYKKQQILEGEGDAAYKKLIMTADGALDKKLATYERVQAGWATAFGTYTGNIVPQYQTGGNTSNNGATQFMEIMGMKAAKDLGLDMSLPKK